jgi:Phage integrase SAM-like domain
MLGSTPPPASSAGSPRRFTAAGASPASISRSWWKRRGGEGSGPAQFRICLSTGSRSPPLGGPSTASHTHSIIDAYLKPYFGHLGVGRITTEDVYDFYGYLLRWGGKRHQPLAPGTVARVHGVLHRAFTQAVRWGWVSVNPVSDASPPRVQPAEI